MTNEKNTIIETVEEYNENGILIYRKNIYGGETWFEYNDNNKLSHYATSDINGNREDQWYEYDERGNNIHYKNNEGYEEWREYDEDNHMIHYKNSNGEDQRYDVWD